MLIGGALRDGLSFEEIETLLDSKDYTPYSTRVGLEPSFTDLSSAERVIAYNGSPSRLRYKILRVLVSINDQIRIVCFAYATMLPAPGRL